MDPTDEEAQRTPGPKSGDDPVPLRDEDLKIVLVWAIKTLRPFARCYMGIDPNG